MSDDQQTAMIAQVVKLQMSIYELICSIAIIAIGTFAVHWWEYSVVASAGVILIYGIYAYRHEAKDFHRLARVEARKPRASK